MSAMPSYKTHDPKGWCGDPKRGAALGRHTYEGDPSFAGKLVLRRIYLDSGGYDPNGTYWGHGRSLYWFANHEVEPPIDGMFRADSREDAKEQIRARYPKARFYR